MPKIATFITVYLLAMCNILQITVNKCQIVIGQIVKKINFTALLVNKNTLPCEILVSKIVKKILIDVICCLKTRYITNQNILTLEV